MKYFYLITVSLIMVILTTCDREFDNPWDEKSALAPESWAPSNLQILDVSITEKKLTWTYGDHNIEGFKIDRTKGDEQWQQAIATLPKEARSWSDTEIIPDPSLEYSYRLYAFAGKNSSAQQTTSSRASFPPPTNPQIAINSITSVTLSWQDKSTGEEGFKIDRKVGDGDWQVEFVAVPANQTSFTDDNVNLDVNNYIYRIYAFRGNWKSAYNETTIKALETFCGIVTFNYRGQRLTYGTVEGQNGTCWIDRNLGASRVATAYNDSEAYGDLFQWGRGDDGHQLRNSSTTSALSSSDNPGHGNFITASADPYDWRSPQNDNLWQGDGGINDVCPAGWRVPTETELNNERLSWSSNNYNGAFASPLKFVAGGFRLLDGSLGYVGSYGFYWSSFVSGSGARYLGFYSSDAGMYSDRRVGGSSVRCIRDE